MIWGGFVGQDESWGELPAVLRVQVGEGGSALGWLGSRILGRTHQGIKHRGAGAQCWRLLRTLLGGCRRCEAGSGAESGYTMSLAEVK